MSASHSVIVPVLDGARHIRECLQSALTQLAPADELIVIDNGSTDGTPDIVRGIADPRIRVLNESRRGPAAARNAGLRIARGRHLTFLDSDDIWVPGRVAALQAAIASQPGANAAYGRIRLRYDGVAPDDRSVFDGAFVQNWSLWSYTFDRSLIERTGPLDESLPMGEDIEYILRLRRAGMSSAVSDEIVSIYRRHAGNVSNDRVAVQATFMRAISRNVARIRAARAGTSV